MQQSGAILKLSNFLKRLFKKRGHGIISDDLIKELETKFNYQFKDKNILIQALKHRSFLAVTGEARLFSNERLELLGDSVLGIIVTEHLFKKFPDKEEGDLTSMKSLVVSRKILAKTANNLNLGKYILLNDAEKKAGGRHRPSIVADAFEALTGAIYLDGGLAEAVKFIHNYLLINLDEVLSEEQNKNFKSMLLEYSQSQNYGLPIYSVKKETGPDHNKTFTIEVKVNDSIKGIGIGNSKKRAEQIAAKNALKKLTVN